MREDFRLNKSIIPKPSRYRRPKSDASKEKSPHPKLRKLWHNRLINLDESITITNALIGSIGEGVVMVDEYGYISHVNEPALQILGYERGEIEGAWVQDALPSFDKNGQPIDPQDRLLAQAILTGKPVAGIIMYKNRNGDLVPIFNTSSAFIVNGKPMGGILVFRDISKEMQVERAKDEFVSLASHQLRTPLTSIRFFGELLKDPYYGKLSKKQSGYLNNIILSTERMISLVSELLDVSRLNLGRLEINPVPTNIYGLLKTQAAEVRPLAKSSGVKFSLQSEVDKSQTVPLDPTLLSQVIHNLLTNAIRYSSEVKGGRVSMLLSKNRRYYQISVSDNGIGIPASAQSRVYERFFRADNAVQSQAEGTGLGLYLVKEIVESSGGKISHKSKENQGTTFDISIPLSGMAPSK